MITINFKEFKVYYDLSSDRTQIIDWRKELGNYLLARLGGVEGVDLAMRIYRSDASIELTDEEYETLKNLFAQKLEQGGVVAAYYYSFLKNATKKGGENYE